MIARRFFGFLLGLAFLFAAPQVVQAQTCTFSATNVNFGNADTLGSGSTETVGTITASCTTLIGLLSSITVTINLGSGRGGFSGSSRQMTSLTTATPLNYQLYKDSARTQVFGNGSNGGTPVVLSGSTILNLLSNSSVQIPIYGRVTGGQNNVVPGNYLSRFDRTPTDVSVIYTTCTAIILCTDRSATFTFDVLAAVSPNCLVTANDLDFGSVGLLNANVDASSQIQVTCTSQSSYNVALDYGFYGAGPGDRKMQNPAGNQIFYELYQNAARNLVWGGLVDGAAQSSSGSGTTQVFSVFGRVPPQATPPAGVYSDTIVVTVTY